jgi:hypothetical protein
MFYLVIVMPMFLLKGVNFLAGFGPLLVCLRVNLAARVNLPVRHAFLAEASEKINNLFFRETA